MTRASAANDQSGPRAGLRYLFDAYELAPGAGKSIGIYNYAKNLWRALVARLDGSFEIVAVCNGACAPDFAVEHPHAHVRVVGDKAPGTIERQLWLRARAAVVFRRERADVYFSPKGFLPNGIRVLSPRSRSVVVIHDLIPFWYADVYPGYFGYLEQLVVNHGLAHSVRKADCLVAISVATATDIEERLGRTREVIVVHNGVPRVSPGPPPVACPYIFAVTSHFPHKNSAGVLAAYRVYRQLVASPLPLVVCGMDDPHETGVIVLKGISDSALHGCYAHARLFLFLSLVEGFGFPPVEAMSHGTPVLCSDIPSLREVTQGVVSYVSPTDPQQAGKRIAELLTQVEPDRKRMLEAISGYSWDNCAKGILEALKRASEV